MTSHAHHEEIISNFHKQWKGILEHSSQAIYAYLDDEHKVCNKKFSDLLGYESPETWAKNNKPFAEAFVDESSQEALTTAYSVAVEDLAGSTISVCWKVKSGDIEETTVMLVPVIQDGHVIVVHFIE